MHLKRIITLFSLIILIAPHAFSQSCQLPFNIRFLNKTDTSVDVTWSDINPNPKGWEIEIVKRGESRTNMPSFPIFTDKEAFIQNLEPSTSYELYIRTVCVDNYSNWNVAIPFNTIIDVQTSCQINIPIKDNGTEILDLNIPVPSHISEPILGTNIFLKSVDLILEHAWPADLKITLISPQGQELVLSEHNGTVTHNFGNISDTTCTQFTSFSVDACNSLKSDRPPFIGLYKPDGSISGWHPDTLSMGNWKLKFFDRAVKDAGILRYLNVTFSDEMCVLPENFSIVSTDINQVDVSWDYLPPCNTLQINVFEGETQKDTIYVPCSEGSFSIDQLLPNSEYTFSISSLCSHLESSSESCPVTTTTTCEPISIAESFDDYETCEDGCKSICLFESNIWYNDSEDDGQDWIVHSGKTETINTGPDGDINGGGNYIYIENNPQICGSGNQVMLKSTCMDIKSNPSGCDMSFYYHLNGLDIKSLSLEVSVDGEQTWIELFRAEGHHGNRWIRYTLSLSEFDNMTGVFRFTAVSGDGPMADIALDQIEFYKSIPAASLTTYYYDNDGDGYGNDGVTIQICSLNPPANYSALGGDCDDDNPDIHPNATEIQCNGIDENCNGNEDDQPAFNPIIVTEEIIPSSCNGSTDGQLSLNISGGNAPYSVSWNNGMTGQSITELSNGVYYATITDVGGCIFNTPFYQIDASTNLNIITTGITTADCLGKSNGNIEISHSFDFPPYSYLWSDGTTGKDLINVPEGQYSVTVTDDKNCFAVLSDIKVSSRPSILAGIKTQSAPLCHDMSTGKIELFTTGGTPPYQYQWSNGQETETLSAVREGHYSCTISDSENCHFIFNTVLNSPPALRAEIINTEDVRCYGESNGSIRTRTSGGTPGYTYRWNNTSATTENIFNISAGDYILTITDANGCKFILDTIQVLEPDPLTINIESIKPATCKSGRNGSVEVSTIGGNGGYRYVWNDLEGTTSIIDSLTSGNYSVIVYDVAGCKSGIPNFYIPAKNIPVDISLFLLQDNDCYRQSNAQITAVLNNGTPPFDYNWSQGLQYFSSESSDTVTQLPSGIYTLTITDSNGCVGESNQVTIKEKPPYNFNIIDIENNLCPFDSSGVISIKVNGGEAPHSVIWNQGIITGKTISNLPNGNYSAVITDAKQCKITTQPITIHSLSDIKITSQVSPDYDGLGIGDICIQISGGFPAYDIQWSNGAINQSCISNLNAGNYSVTITDAEGCEAIFEFEVERSSSVNHGQKPQIQLFPNPTFDKIVVLSEIKIDFIKLLDSNGKVIYKETLENHREFVLNLNPYPAGLYNILLTSKGQQLIFRVVKM